MVIIVAELVASEVLHWRLMRPEVEMSNRMRCGHAVVPAREADRRMSATV